MKISEIFEQITAPVAAQGPGGQPGSPALGTSPTAQAQTTATDVANTTSAIQQSITKLKPTLAAAGGNTAIDAKALAQGLATQDPKKPGMTPQVTQGLKNAVIPSLTDILVDPEAARKLGQLILQSQSATRKPGQLIQSVTQKPGQLIQSVTQKP